MDKAKEVEKHKRKEKFKKEIERTIEDVKKFEYALINLKGNVSSMEDVEASSINIINGARRDVLLGIENIGRIENTKCR